MNNKTSFLHKADAIPEEDEAEETDPLISNSFSINEVHETSSDDQRLQAASVLKLFKYSSILDKFFILIGTLASISNGVIVPLIALNFTSVFDSFVNVDRNHSIKQRRQANVTDPLFSTDVEHRELLSTSVSDPIFWFSMLGVASFVLSYLQVTFWLIAAENQIRRIRVKLFRSILRQEMAWFDTVESRELSNLLTSGVQKIKDGINDKLGDALQNLAIFVFGVAFSFFKGWKLSFVVLSLAPVTVLAGGIFSKLTASFVDFEQRKAYSQAGSVAEDVLTAIRTVFAFNSVKKEHKRYEERLEDAKMFGIKKSIANGCVYGFLWFTIYCGHALGFWYGWKLSTEVDPVTGKAEYTVGTICVVFFCLVYSFYRLGNVAPYFSSLRTARVAAHEVFNTIERIPTIDVESESGDMLHTITGDIQFNNVSFNYMSTLQGKISGLNLRIKAGKTVALVGSSGCGKSTCIQLLQRFYDPLCGAVLVDNIDLRELNLKWWRENIGVVTKEPVLFAGASIYENIQIGRDNATQQEIEAAAKKANAHEFIMKLSEKYHTLVGKRGLQLTPGQKQRITIARALLRNPKILLYDEALDRESEAALERASKGRTTVIIGNRLAAIQNADVIYTMHKGKLVEAGTHNQLMDKRGVYFQLVVLQDPGKPLIEENGADVELESETQDEKKPSPSVLQVLALNKPEWGIVLIGCLACIINGLVHPVLGVVFANLLAVFRELDTNKQKEMIIHNCVLFVVCGLVIFLAKFLQDTMFGISGENLTKRLRSKGFEAMLTQENAWHDEPENNSDALCTKLAVEAAAVQGATGVHVGYNLMIAVNLGCGFILSLICSWPLALINLAFLPFLVMRRVSLKEEALCEQAEKVANEAIGNITTVCILNNQERFVEDYAKKLKVPFKTAIYSANTRGLVYGLANCAVYSFSYAAVFACGAYLVDNRFFGTSFENILLVCSIFSFCGVAASRMSSHLADDYSKAKTAAKNILELLSRKSKINNWEPESSRRIRDENYNGEIAFRNVRFNYPTRPNVKILKNFTLTIKKGQKVALVGSSGCGKSTVPQLLEHFYEPVEGSVTLCGESISGLNLRWLRAQIGLVPKESALFNTTIAQNIAYGCEPRNAIMHQIIEAARKANIHDFISSLPNGYKTIVDSKGTQLTGGEVQRIAIARMFLKDPKILIIETTSALDNESAEVLHAIEEALTRLQEGRTCISIARHLSTVKHVDVIHMLKDGVIVESGTHNQLMLLDGFYAELHRKQHF